MEIWQGSNRLTDVGSYGDKHDHSGSEEDLGCFIKLKGSSPKISLAPCHIYLRRSRREPILFFQHDEHRFEEKARIHSYTFKYIKIHPQPQNKLVIRTIQKCLYETRSIQKASIIYSEHAYLYPHR